MSNLINVDFERLTTEGVDLLAASRGAKQAREAGDSMSRETKAQEVDALLGQASAILDLVLHANSDESALSPNSLGIATGLALDLIESARSKLLEDDLTTKEILQLARRASSATTGDES